MINFYPKPYTNGVWLHFGVIFKIVYFYLVQHNLENIWAQWVSFVSFQSLTVEEVLQWAQSFEKLMATKCEYYEYVIFEIVSVILQAKWDTQWGMYGPFLTAF